MIQIVFNFLFRFFGIFLDSYWWTRPPDPPPLVSKMYKQIFLTNLDNKINLTPKINVKCPSRSAGHPGRSAGPHVLAARRAQGRMS